MTTSREKFEAWYRDCFAGTEPARDCPRWLAWQAAFAAGQEAMRERAQQVCHEAAADRDVTDCIADEIGRLENER